MKTGRYFCANIFVLSLAAGMTSLSAGSSEMRDTNVRKEKAVAFPGAEGHGRYTTGGRGGKVYHVTSLKDDGSHGTLRWALKHDGPKTIVFDTSGTIRLKSELRTDKDSLTIAGQTSPGGICLADYGFTVNSNNVIIRFLSFRSGETNGKAVDGLGVCGKKNIIIDHCSISWGVGEYLSVYGVQNSTVQWCIVFETLRRANHSKGPHGYDGGWGGRKATYHHNLIAHCENRVFRLKSHPSTLPLTECVDIRNNVFYNWGGDGCYGGEFQYANIVNNYYKPGPATGKAHEQACKSQAYIPYIQGRGAFYIDGNIMEGNNESTAGNWTQKTKTAIRLMTSIEYGEVITHSAERAYNQVLKYAGSCIYGGKRNTSGFISGRKYKGISPWPELGKKGVSAPVDSDGDGMPDEWEIEKRLNPQDPADGNEKSKDYFSWFYTNLEVYLNSLVRDIIEKQSTGITVRTKGGDEEIFESVEEQPQFPGGSDELKNYLKIPVPAVALMGCGPIGRVIGQCVIEKNGEVTFSKVVRGVDPRLDRDALELIKNMPRWTPGKQDGKEVRVLMTFVFNHKIIDE